MSGISACRARALVRLASTTNHSPNILGYRFASTDVTTQPPLTTKASSDITIPPEPKDVIPADTFSGAPVELRYRSVRIYQPTKSTMQSGGTNAEKWRIDFDILQGGGKWENPLMGWASSADYMQGTRMSFRSKEDAIHFAEKQGWDYFVEPPAARRIPPKNYSENYLYRATKLRIQKTK